MTHTHINVHFCSNIFCVNTFNDEDSRKILIIKRLISSIPLIYHDHDSKKDFMNIISLLSYQSK